MKTINTEALIKKQPKLTCAHCGAFTGTKCKYICPSCRKRMDIRSASDITRYFLVRHLLRTVKSAKGGEQA